MPTPDDTAKEMGLVEIEWEKRCERKLEELQVDSR